MNEKRNIPIILLLFAGFVIGVYYLFFVNTSKGGDPWEMIPDTPAMILQTDHPRKVMDELTTNNEIWKALKDASLLDGVVDKMHQFDSLWKAKPSVLKNLNESSFYLALYRDKNNKNLQYMMLSKPMKAPKLDFLKAYLTRNLTAGNAVLSDLQGGREVLKIINGKSGATFYLSSEDGVLIFTPSRNLMLSSSVTYHANGPKFIADSSFIRVKATSGKKANARVYLYYPELVKAMVDVVSPNYLKPIEGLEHWAQWSEVDVILKKDEVIFTGYTSALKKDGLQRFSAQQPALADAFTLFPFNTTFSFNLGYAGNLLNKVNSNHFKLAYQSDLKQLLAATNREVCFVSNALNKNELNNKSWALVGLNDPLTAEIYLKKLASKSGSRFVQHYGSHTIRKLSIPGFLKHLYGDLFGGIRYYYYTILGDYAVFANSSAALVQLIQYTETGKTLDLNENFKGFSDNLADRANLSMILKLRSLMGMSDRYLTKKAALQVIDHDGLLNNFQGLAVQYSRDGSLFYTNFYLRYNQRYKEENLALWKTVLRDEIVGKPFLVKDHNTRHYDVIVFDKGKRMYLINPEGKVLWVKRLSDLPISRIYQVDYYKNGKIQFLFNTAHHVYLIDRKGNFVKGYPYRLLPAATNGLSLFDYTKRRDYRILIAQADKQVYDYSIKGNQVRGWVKPRMKNIVLQKVVRLLANNKDYILITDINGDVKIVNRRGVQRIYLNGKINKARHSTYYVNKTNSKGIILTTNREGKLVYISSRGRLQKTDFGKFSSEHYFLYEDFNGDFSRDFIFVDHKSLKVYDRFKKLLFHYDFPSDISVQPEFFTLGRKQKVLGIVASGEKTIYLFDKEGNILISSGLTGETPFTVGSLYNNSNVNLITAAGKTLYNYRMK
jgi:hypothetical protein